MARSSSVVCGIYRDRSSTEIAIKALRVSGFSEADIFPLFPDQLGTKKVVRKEHTRLTDGVVLGAGAGTFTAIALEWVIRESVLTRAHPFLTIALALITGSTIGSLIGGLVGLLIPKKDEHYEGCVRRGDVLIAVHCESQESKKKAAVILERTRGKDVSSESNFAMDLVRPDRLQSRPLSEKTVIAPPSTMAGVSEGSRKSAA